MNVLCIFSGSILVNLLGFWVIDRTLTTDPIGEIPVSDQPLLPPVTSNPGQAVLEPTTLAGLSLAGLGLAALRRKRLNS